jgi:Methyltransferase domain
MAIAARTKKEATCPGKTRPECRPVGPGRGVLSRVERYLDTAILFRQRDDLHRFAIQEAPPAGLLLEFGVFRGASINAFADHMEARGDSRPIYGFDAFLGLEEPWNGVGYLAHDRFNRAGEPPDVRRNVRLVTGWIKDTLPGFLDQHPDPIALVHIDTDTYKPAKLILSLCKDRFKQGSILLFDELLAYPGWQTGEFKALIEEIEASRYEWIGFYGTQGALRITT